MNNRVQKLYETEYFFSKTRIPQLVKKFRAGCGTRIFNTVFKEV